MVRRTRRSGQMQEHSSAIRQYPSAKRRFRTCRDRKSVDIVLSCAQYSFTHTVVEAENKSALHNRKSKLPAQAPIGPSARRTPC